MQTVFLPICSSLYMGLLSHLVGTRFEIGTPVDVSQLFHQSICGLQMFHQRNVRDHLGLQKQYEAELD